MKKILLSALTLLIVVACSKFDDSEIWSELKDHEHRFPPNNYLPIEEESHNFVENN